VYDGLVANPVRCIYQDSKGFIWIGTYEGLSRYDGYKFTNYSTANGLSHNLINSIFEVNGKLLVAENNGAIDLIQNNYIQKGLMAASPANNIKPYYDRLLITTDTNGFYEYRNGDIILPAQEKTGTLIAHFLPLNDSLLIVDGETNLFIYKEDLRIHSSLKNIGAYIFDLFIDSKKRIWTCTAKGLELLQIFPEKKIISFAKLPAAFNFPPLNNNNVTSMLEEEDGGFWIGTNKGLVRVFPNGTFQVYAKKDGLPSDFINTLYRDKEKNIWIGTALGLAKWVAKNNIVFYNTEDKDFKNDVEAIQYSDTKKIILATYHGLQQFYPDTKKFKDLNKIYNNYHTPVAGSYPLLVHSGNKIGILDSVNNEIVIIEKLDTTITAVSSIMNSNGTIFLASMNGLFAVKGKLVKKILPYRITSLLVATDGNIWAGTWQDGLYRIHENNDADLTYDTASINSTIRSKQIRSLYLDSKKNIWVGTRHDGVFCLTSATDSKFNVLHFNRQSGLMSDWVLSIAETKDNDIWIGTHLGLDKLVKESSDYRAFNFSKAVNFFAQIKGIAPFGNNSWICIADNGIAYFKDENIHQTPPLQATILSASLGVLKNKLTLFSPTEKISLKPYQNAARFEFSALGFINEKQTLYSYRLLGSSDTTWSKPENIHEASYASLSSGAYTFEVRTIGWNGEPGKAAAFSFTIATPFWKQGWFIVLCVALIAALFYALYRYRIRQLLRLQNVRNSIATDLHDDIGSSLTNISILSELSNKNLSQPVKAQEFLQRISEEVQASSQAMDDIIWSVNSHNDSLHETMARMRRYAAELFDNSETNCHLQLDENTGNKKFSMEQRRDVYLIYKEALNNIHKHANAKNVWIDVSQNQNHLLMQIKDDGKGFNIDHVTHRNGLKNLRSRTKKWNGKIQIHSEENKGTAIEVKIPLRD